MKSIFKNFLALSLSMALLGCITNPNLKEDEDLNSLVTAYIDNNIQANKKLESRRDERIESLSVEKADNGFTVSAELNEAPIKEILNRVASETGMPYLLETTALNRTATTRFQKLPLLEAMNIILESNMAAAEMRNNVLVIKSNLGEIKPETDVLVHREFTLQNLHVDTAMTLLDGLYPKAPTTGAGTITFGPVRNNNSIYLYGMKSEVLRALNTLNQADSELKHITIEVVVVEFDSKDLENLGSKFADISSGKFSGANFNFGSLADNNILFTAVPGASNPAQFTAMIDFLVSNNKARLISRPFISTLSGEEAIINISSNRYVMTDTAVSGATITAPIPIESGVILKITPVALSDNKIRMKVYAEDSQFAGDSANIAAEVDKNSADTIMHVDDGQTLIIGGMVLNRTTWSNSGFPWLRNIPGVNLFLAKQGSLTVQREVAIYVTPNTWKPSLNTPLIQQKAFTAKEGAKEPVLKK